MSTDQKTGRTEQAPTPSIHALVGLGDGSRQVLATVCVTCSHMTLYRRRHCSSCGGADMRSREIALRGTVDAATTIGRSRAEGWKDRVPWSIVHVRLDKGPTVLACSTRHADELIGSVIDLIAIVGETPDTSRLEDTAGRLA